MNQKLHWFFYVMLSALICISCSEDSNPLSPTSPFDLEYNITIDPNDFEDEDITGNDYFSLIPGTTFFYEGEDEDGKTITVQEIVTSDTKVVIGVTCVVVNAREFEEGELVEDTFDWYAQDEDGNVWYFGEDSWEVKNGVNVNNSGSWEAGVDGALPGIIMLNKPLVGLSYRQEYYEDEAEDVAEVLSLNATVTVPYGTFNNCLQTAEWNLLEPGIIEHKFYAKDVGLVHVVAVKGEEGFESLTNITTP